MQEHKTDDLTVTVDQKPQCVVEMEIKATPKLAEEEYQRAIKHIRKEVSLPGFRKGKAPEKVILTKYEKQVEGEFRNLFLNRATKEAMRLAALIPWNREESINADIVQAKREEGGHFKLKFESFPEIPLVDPKAIQIEQPEVKEVTDEAVEKHIDSLRYHHAEWEEVEGREIQEGDFVIAEMSIIPSDGGEPSPGRESNFHMDKEHLETWMYDYLLGKKTGEKGTVTPPPPEKPEDDPLSRPLRSFEVTVKKIQLPKLEEMDEEFFKKFGAESEENFKEKIKEYLVGREKEMAKNKIHRAIQLEILKHYPFELPKSLFDQEKERSLRQILEDLKQAHYSDNEIKGMNEQVEMSARARTDTSLRSHFLLMKLAETLNLNITKEEIFQELIRESIEAGGTIQPDLMQQVEKYEPLIREKLMLNKAMEHIAEQNSAE